VKQRAAVSMGLEMRAIVSCCERAIWYQSLSWDCNLILGDAGR
jgi:hypothetical protein